MTIDKDRLKALAEAATRPVVDWRVTKDHNNVNIVTGDGGWSIFSAWHTPDGKGIANAEFAAAANPNTVLYLLAENERLEDKNGFNQGLLKAEVSAYYQKLIDDHWRPVAREREKLKEAILVAAECFARVTSSDGSGHADLARSVLRIAGIPDSEATAMVDQWVATRPWGNNKEKSN